MISIKNLTLLLAVLLMGLCLVSSVSAMDIDDSDALSVSDDLSGSSVSSEDANIPSDSNLNNLESVDTGSSDVNSENEVLSTDQWIEDSDLECDSNNGNSKNVLGASALGSSALQASSKTKTSITASKSVYKGESFSMTLKDSNGNALANQKVSIKINGKTYNRTTNSKGVASLTINLNVNNYTVVCSFAGTSAYSASSLSLTLAVKKNPNAYSIKDIEAAATNVKAFVTKNKRLPTTVTVGSKKLKISEFSYLASKAISNLNSNNKKDIILLSGISNGGSSTHTLKSTIYKAQYVDAAKGVVSTIGNKKVPPTYVAVKDTNNKVAGNANFDLYTFAFSKILDFHKSKNALPNYCTFESSAITSTYSQKTTSIKAASTSITRGDPYKVTLVDNNGKALANQKITITINGKSYSRTTDSNGSASLTINLVSGKYSTVTAFSGSSTYKASKLSNTVTVKNSSSRFYINDIETAATNVKKYVNNNGVLPKTVTVAGTKLTISQFSYLMSKAVCNINASNTKFITIPSIGACNSSGDKMSAKIYKAEYLDMAKRVYSWGDSKKVAPVYARVYSSSGSLAGKAEFDLYTFALAKILDFHKSKKYLPSYCTFESSVFTDSVVPTGNLSKKINYNSSQFKNGLNELNTETNLSQYLVGTGRSAITTSIKNLAANLTKGLNSTDAKALAIYNYVRDEIDYSYYADSKYGAAGTLSAGSGNCVDQASLVVALCRAAGIHARYAHAKGCTFSSGLVTGHVWAQILVNGVWYSADATSSRNRLGNIQNWNTNSYSNLNKYAAIPF